MPKKQQSPFDLSYMFPKTDKNFGFNIESSFVQGPSQKQKSNNIKRKKYENIRYQQLKTGSTEAISPSEDNNIYGIYRNE